VIVLDKSILITNAHVITPTAEWPNGWLLTRGRHIALMGSVPHPELTADEVIDAHGLTLLPGFIDVHVHGGVGHEVMESREAITAALKVVAEQQGAQPDGATILGVHLEGPYLNVAKRGAQNPTYFRTAAREEALAFLDFNVIRLLSIAPEFTENQWLIGECVRRGITVSVAHSAATYEQVRHAVSLGLTHATHTYNAMVGLDHREPGTLGAVLTTPEIACELIADNIHVHPAAMQLLFAAKGPDRVILITDAVRGAGLGDGEYTIDNRQVIVRDGAVRLISGTLAGSALTLNKGLYNFMQATGQPLSAVWKTSSLNAARAIHIADRKGSLEVGKDADLVLIDDQINVQLTIAEGVIVYRA